MPKERVVFEDVRFDKQRIWAASHDLIRDLAKHVSEGDKDSRNAALLIIRDTIENGGNTRFVWDTPLLKLVFSGFAPPNFRIEGDMVLFTQRPPYFALHSGEAYNILDEERKENVDEGITSALSQAVRQHSLELSYEDPVAILNFPLDFYAERITTTAAVLL